MYEWIDKNGNRHTTEEPPYECETDLPVNQVFCRNEGVHVTHCCNVCGCKYCDDNCPVASGKLAPAYDCEDCVSARECLVDKLSSLTEEELVSLLKSVGHRRRWLQEQKNV